MSADLSNDFNAALEYSQLMRDTYLVHFYRAYSMDNRYVFVDKSACSSLLQKELAIDTIYHSKHGGSVCVEEKIEQWPGYQRTNFALEIESCTNPGRERKGWMHYAKADYLFYAFAYDGDMGLDAYLIDFPKLRKWFWSLSVRYPTHTMDTINRTRVELTPIQDVIQAVPTWNFDITSDGCREKPRQVNTHTVSAEGMKRASQGYTHKGQPRKKDGNNG